MATGKVARRTAVGDVAELLDSPEVAALIHNVAALGDPRGRKGYGARALIGACLVKTLFALPTWTRVAALIAEHPNRLHADLVILGRLGQALARAREMQATQVGARVACQQ